MVESDHAYVERVIRPIGGTCTAVFLIVDKADAAGDGCLTLLLVEQHLNINCLRWLDVVDICRDVLLIVDECGTARCGLAVGEVDVETAEAAAVLRQSLSTHITPTIAYYTSAKHMWEFLKQTYSHDKNMSKVLQVEEELLKLQQGDSDLAQYFASVKSAYEKLKALSLPCQSCYKSHFEQHMVAKFLAGLSPDFAVAKAQMLTKAEIPDLAEAYNRLSRLVVTLSPSSTDAPSSALAVLGGRGQSAISGSRGQAFNRGRGGRSLGGGRGRFQCTFLEDLSSRR
ncbi:hypothetical protein EJ110_NYTH51875 [Nymphaea thermarum]|nr:hypothetical protein EJ110_NYTH51875 [Nymphaea thermarum]